MKRYGDEKMCPMPRKTRIRCPLAQCVERPLVDSCALLLDSLRGPSRVGAIRRRRQTSGRKAAAMLTLLVRGIAQ
jgi:hypothetical protein